MWHLHSSSEMAGVGVDVGRCLLPSCKSSGSLKTFKIQAVKKLIECAAERGDGETYDNLQTILSSQGEQASVQLHKTCYCSYTSKNMSRSLC